MSKPKTNTKTTRVAKDQKLIDGVQKRFAGTSLVLAGKTFTAPEVVQFLQERIDVAGPVETAHATWKNAVAAEKAKVAETQKYVLALTQLVHAMFGTNADALTEFGLTPHTRASLTTEATALRIDRMKATRKARGTAGPKQKAKIKGVVPTPPAIPPTSNGTPTPHA
jgi:hypothetical protein